MSTANLLIEVFTEELPPKSLRRLGEAFSEDIFAHLKAAKLTTDSSSATSFATPRRLAVLISDVLDQAQDYPVREKLLPTSIAYDAQGNATAPLLKKLATLGHADVDLLDAEEGVLGGVAQVGGGDEVDRGVAHGQRRPVADRERGVPDAGEARRGERRVPEHARLLEVGAREEVDHDHVEPLRAFAQEGPCVGKVGAYARRIEAELAIEVDVDAVRADRTHQQGVAIGVAAFDFG